MDFELSRCSIYKYDTTTVRYFDQFTTFLDEKKLKGFENIAKPYVNTYSAANFRILQQKTFLLLTLYFKSGTLHSSAK